MTPFEISIQYAIQTCSDAVPLFIVLGLAFTGALIHKVRCGYPHVIPEVRP